MIATASNGASDCDLLRSDQVRPLSTVVDIDQAICSLPADDFCKPAERFDAKRAEAWDARLEADAAAG